MKNSKKIVLSPKRGQRPHPSLRPRVSGKRRTRATASEILGRPAGETPRSRAATIPRKWRRHYRHLILLREHLRAQISGRGRDAAEELPAFSMHMADSGTDNFDRDFALSMLSADQDALWSVEQAIHRIETGAYGMCELTGKPIPERRLDAIPWTRFSTAAQQQLEKTGELEVAKLKGRRSLSDVEAEDGEPADTEEEESEKGRRRARHAPDEEL